VAMGDDRGGWRRLREAVAEQAGQRMSMEDPFYVSSGALQKNLSLSACDSYTGAISDRDLFS
jgi:hypothetical protein